ncbi:phage tail sheath family protein [Taishania pollutisoli]|uniref:phage tail sheath family protein n=1 Tax=Taishania pollutisoli TaxID=2766479 RepID=UPI001C1E7478|nr:phage tail sheath C-terminal domain-containing protein [Taishania pollutisoli]
MCAMKTPGVYVVEKNAFPNSVVEVATAVPAFIGYTEIAKNGSKSLLDTPWRISSLAEYEQYFGGAPKPEFKLEKNSDPDLITSIFVDKDTVKITLTFLYGKLALVKKTVADLEKINAAKAKDTTSEKNYQPLIDNAKAKVKEAVDSLQELLKVFSDSLTEVYDDKNVIVTETGSLIASLKDDIATTEAVKKIDQAFNELLLAIDIESVPSQYYTLSREDNYNLYYHLRFFFANGGGPCYIVSVGKYGQDLEKDKLEKGISLLLKEQEPTIVLVPEAAYLENPQDCYDIQTAVLRHCGGDMKNRVAILDVYKGHQDRNHEDGDVVTSFREAIGTEFLDFGAAYYPWLNTSIVSENEISFKNLLGSWEALKPLLSVHSIYLKSYIADLQRVVTAITDKKQTDANEEITLHKVFSKQSPIYASIIKEKLQQLNLLPPSSAMAGIYTLVDSTKEVWKAPANIGLSNVISPTVNISHVNQEDLNVPLNGKAVNAIRYFVGEGIKVWGARTLDGNSLDWRYINVRRTMIMLEESIKNATKAFVFDPNTANTWVSVRSMINNFLNGIWKRGGLAGAIPDDAFSVHIGLGETMTPEDILEGIMRITVLVAIVRPAEFIEITFQQQMQKS